MAAERLQCEVDHRVDQLAAALRRIADFKREDVGTGLFVPSREAEIASEALAAAGLKMTPEPRGAA